MPLCRESLEGDVRLVLASHDHQNTYLDHLERTGSWVFYGFPRLYRLWCITMSILLSFPLLYVLAAPNSDISLRHSTKSIIIPL